MYPKDKRAAKSWTVEELVCAAAGGARRGRGGERQHVLEEVSHSAAMNVLRRIAYLYPRVCPRHTRKKQISPLLKDLLRRIIVRDP